MPETLDPKYLDKRTAPRYLREGLLDDKVHERFLKSLPDVAAKAQVVETSMAEGEEVKPAKGEKAPTHEQ